MKLLNYNAKVYLGEIFIFDSNVHIEYIMSGVYLIRPTHLVISHIIYVEVGFVGLLMKSKANF